MWDPAAPERSEPLQALRFRQTRGLSVHCQTGIFGLGGVDRTSTARMSDARGLDVTDRLPALRLGLARNGYRWVGLSVGVCNCDLAREGWITSTQCN